MTHLEENKKRQRTIQQNKALHVLFAQIAEALNDAGYSVQTVIKTTHDISFTPYNVKELLWRNFQEMTLGKHSTTELTTKEIDEVYDQLNRFLGEKFGTHIPFPSLETMMWEDE